MRSSFENLFGRLIQLKAKYQFPSSFFHYFKVTFGKIKNSAFSSHISLCNCKHVPYCIVLVFYYKVLLELWLVIFCLSYHTSFQFKLYTLFLQCTKYGALNQLKTLHCLPQKGVLCIRKHPSVRRHGRHIHRRGDNLACLWCRTWFIIVVLQPNLNELPV